MADYWVGPSLRQQRPRWAGTEGPQATGKLSRAERRRARPITPRRWRALVRLTNVKLHDITFLARYAAHIAVIVLTSTVALLHGVDVASYVRAAPKPVEAEAPVTDLWPSTPREEGGYLTWNALPQTIIPERPAAARMETITYQVREGDNPNIIAERFGLQPSTIIWSNSAAGANPDLLTIGQVLVIPPVDGVLHTVKEGDTLAAIATKYQADPAIITAYEGNHVTDPAAPLVVGQYVIVPGGVVPYVPPPAPAPAPSTTTRVTAPAASSSTSSTSYVGSSGCCRWPVRGRITTQPSSWHMALDIATSLGTPVVAADGGRVVAAGWDNTGYGYRVIIDHGNGLRTLYAHLSYFNVDYGDYVNKGVVIGKIGSTGRSTGPHLHFEVRRNGVRQNPWNWLP